MVEFKVVIPARFQSTRLPGKPLLDIAGKPMIQRVYENACDSNASAVVIATDDKRIQETADGFGAQVCMTSETHRSGTDRIAEVVRTMGWPDDAIVVNIQGDEPTMPASLAYQVAHDMEDHPRADMTTLSTPISEQGQLFDPNVVKVVTDEKGYALYFSRAPIPWHRDEFSQQDRALPKDTRYYRHIGLYAYRAAYLEKYINLPASTLEKAESLEQLRVLSHGGCIHVSKAEQEPGHGIDTAEDLERVRKLYQ
jgi:3-deoxy-manno-octulosonate cytidylyltransferase (CMP-KDO synthetase)